MKKNLALILILISIALGGCAVSTTTDPRPPVEYVQNNSDYKYTNSSQIPLDMTYYHIKGEVAGDTESLTRQTSAGGGFYAPGLYGAYFGPEYQGKGFVRLLVTESDSDLAPAESVVLLKVTDTKAVLLAPGDHVAFVCRRQYEAVGAIYDYEGLDVEKAATWELDFCRLETPVVK